MFFKKTLTVLLLVVALILAGQPIIPSLGFCDNSSSVVDDQTDDQDDFFEEEPSDSEIDLTFETEDQSDKSFSIKGNLEFKAGYNFAHDRPEPGQTDHRGLSSLTGALDLDISIDLSETFDFVVTSSAFYNYAYNLAADTEYTPHFLDNYEREAELNKAFIRGELTNNLDIKLGRQTVVWGKSDNIRITDILNPINALELGMTDINDLRLPVLMSRLDYYKKDLTVSSYLIHEHRGNRLPVYGSDFYYSPSLEPETETPSMNFKNTGFAMSISKILTGMDIALYFARKYDNNPYLDIKTRNGITQLYFDYAKINMIGMAWNKARGNFLFKAEAAYINGIHLSAYQNNGLWIENSNSYSRIDALLGVEYSGFSDTSVSFEVSDRHYNNLDKQGRNGGVKSNNYQYALRVSKTFLNETLELSGLASYFGASAGDGGFFRFQAEYDVTDSIKIAGGIIFYESGDAYILKESGDNDRIFCSIKYSF